ncbi:MAG: transketolase C-terminal domain-containing protein [Candidatus Hodarchaeales archaeon]|jgi:pyruvate/2-oxoacid:ferredoxin oxidoreductase alpha subunit
MEVVQDDRELLTGNHSVAEAVRLAKPTVVPAYPITPQTEIVERISSMIADKTIDAEFIAVESEHSAMAAAIGASLAGARTFTATSSHGLMYMGELVFWAGLTRVPVVMGVVNRSLNPWNIWVDHQDSMAFRDAGWIQFYAKNNQEVLDLTIMAFKVAEHHKIWMPAMVCLDGFILSHTSALVSIPKEEEIDQFLKPFDPMLVLDPKKPFAHGALTKSDEMVGLRESVIQGFENAKIVINEVFKEYSELVRRNFDGLIAKYGDSDAKIGIMALGTLGEEAEEAVDYILDEKNIKAKILRPRVFRPWPEQELIEEFKKLDKLLILDRSVSFGSGGQLATEVMATLYRHNLKLDVHPQIVGLGGKDVNHKDIAKMVEEL